MSLVDIKKALAEKYLSLAKSVKSQTRRQKYLNKSQKYRRQAKLLSV
jgi:hypothetical protein